MLLEGLFALIVGTPEVMVTLEGGLHKILVPEGRCPGEATMTMQSVGGSISDATFSTSGMNRARVQFDVFADKRGDAAASLDILRRLLNGYRGTLDNGLVIQLVELTNPEPIDFPFEEYARDFRCMSEYYFYFCFPD